MIKLILSNSSSLFLAVFLLSCTQKSANYKFDGCWYKLTQTDSGQFILRDLGG